MAKQDYIPSSDNDFLIWHDQFRTGVGLQLAVVGLLPADAAALGADNAGIHAKVTAMNAAAAAAKQATQDKIASRTAVERNARNLAKRIKAHPAYTPALGALFKIIGPDDSTDLSAAKPDLSGSALAGGSVELAFLKSTSDGVNLYSQRDGDAGFVFLARDTTSPYVDNRPLLVANKPEVRKYKARYVVNDQEIGNASDEVAVTAQP